MVAPDIRSQQFQKLMKLSIRWSSLLPYCYSSATKGGNMVDKFFVTKPWQKSINKRACHHRQNHFMDNLL